MTTLLLSFIVTILAVLGLAVGVLLGRKPIRGSCGGLSCVGLDCATCPSRGKEAP